VWARKALTGMQHRGTTMKPFLTTYADAIALAGTLALAVLTCSFTQTPLDAEGASRTSQYCAPPEENWIAQKIYCRAGPG
jgi:hypothetical protein